MLIPRHTPTSTLVSLFVSSKTIAYIAMRCIMNTKKLLVNIFQSKNVTPGFRRHAVAITNISLPRKLRYRIRKAKIQIVPCMSLYRNTMYYGHKELFCQYPFDAGIRLDILRSPGGIKLSSCQSGRITKCPSFHCGLSYISTSKHQAAVFSP
jgi:hypothetical protein